jgi:hypothetical protein
MRYAPDLGIFGSIVGTVGGHNGYYGNEVWQFEISTRRFATLSLPYGSIQHPGSLFTNGNGVYSDDTNGEFHTSAALVTDSTQPGACHAYGHNVILPPDSETGAGAKGAMIMCVRAARSPNAAGGTADRTHIFDLGQTNRSTGAWARYATNLFVPTESSKVLYFGWAVYDKTRKKVFAGIEAGNLTSATMDELKVLDCVTKQWTSSLVLSENVYQFHSNAWHWEANPDFIINFVNGDGAEANTLELINLSTGTVYNPGTTGTGPELTGGYDFVQSANKIAVYEGGVSTDGGAGTGFIDRVWTLTPPSLNSSAFTSSAWTWSYQTISGPTPPGQTATTISHIGRFVWAEKVKCFLWWANGVDNVQAWNVVGFGGTVSSEAGGGGSTSMLVDQVSSESLLSTLPAVLWYPNFSHLTTLAYGGGSAAGGANDDAPGNTTQFWFPNTATGPAYPNVSNKWFDYVAGWDNNGDSAIISSSPWGLNHLRIGSQYPGDPDSGGNSSNIFHPRKWMFTSTAEVSYPFHAPLFSSAPISAAFLRYEFMVESDVSTGMTQIGMKLPGFETPGGPGHGVAMIGWYKAYSSSLPGKVEFYRYDVTADFGAQQGNPTGSTNISQAYLSFDTWHSIETQIVLNSAVSSNDAVYRIWMDDALIHEYTSFNIWSTTGTLGYIELNYWWPQIFHGGNSLMPSAQIHHRLGAICMASTRIGASKVV